MAIKDESYPSTKTSPMQSEPKPIGQLTLKEAFGALTLPGTWVVVGAISTVLVGLPTAGYKFGTHVAEATAHESMAALQTGNVVKSAELERTKAELAALSSTNQAMQGRLGQKDIQVAQLTDAIGRGKNCDFLRQQIESTKRDLVREQYPMVTEFDKAASEQRDKETIDRLETRLSRYVSQFSTCTKDGA